MAITFGSENIFSSAATDQISTAWLDSTHFVVAYRDGGDGYNGKAVVGVVSGTGITSYGTPVEFISTVTNDVSVAVLDSTHFVVVFRDPVDSQVGKARVGVTSGTTISSFGSANTFDSGGSMVEMSVAALDSTHFVVAYRNGSSSNNGTAIVGVTSGTTISSYGSPNIFNSADTTFPSVAILDSTHFVVAYIDAGNSNHGTAIVGVVSGTTISSYGAENVFNSATITSPSVSVLDSTHFVVTYNDTSGKAIVGVTSGTTISSYGSESEFESTAVNGTSVSALSGTEFVVAYDDGDASGDARVGTVSGTTISGYGDEVAFNSASTDWISVSALNSTDFAIAYKDTGGDGYGAAIIGSNAPPVLPIQINISDTFKPIDAMKINISDSWKDVTGVQVNVGDVWKTVF